MRSSDPTASCGLPVGFINMPSRCKYLTTAVLIIAIANCLMAQKAPKSMGLLGFEYGVQSSSLIGNSFNKTNLHDSIKKNLGASVFSFLMGYQLNYNKIDFKVSVSSLTEDSIQHKLKTTGEFDEISIRYHRILSSTNWLSVSTGFNASYIYLRLINSGKQAFRYNSRYPALEFTGSIQPLKMNEWRKPISTISSLLISASYRLSPKSNRLQESTVTFGFGDFDGCVAIRYIHLDIKNVYKSDMYKLVWYAPLDI